MMSGWMIPANSLLPIKEMTLDKFQKELGVYLEGCVLLSNKTGLEYVVFVDEMGALKEIPKNQRLSSKYGQSLFGDAFLVAENSNGIVKLTKEEVKTYLTFMAKNN
jgi:hypothetical protein